MSAKMLHFVTLGMFIIDDFLFQDDDGQPTGNTLPPQESAFIGGGGTYAAIGARIWLSPKEIGMVIDRGYNFPVAFEERLLEYGRDMWMFRDQPHCETTRALNSYLGEHRNFKYQTSRIRITPRDLNGTKLAKPEVLHFICSPARAATIISEVKEVDKWHPKTIYEPIPDRCIPEELPALKKVLGDISILSPNAEEALSLLSMSLPPTRSTIEAAARKFLDFGIDQSGHGCVMIRSGEMGVYVRTREKGGMWIDAYWTINEEVSKKVIDVTGAGNAFLGGLAAGLRYTDGDVFKAALYGSVSASYVIEQNGLPVMTTRTNQEHETPLWNGEDPKGRLELLWKRHYK